MSSKYAGRHYVAGSMERYIVSSAGKARQVDAIRRDGSEVDIVLMMYEVPAPFSVLLPKVSEGDDKERSPSRMFIAFASIPDVASNKYAFSSLIDSLKTESIVCTQ